MVKTILVGMLAAVCCAAGKPTPSPLLQDVIAEARMSVAMVISYKEGGGSGLGTGFAVNSDGMIVTAAHILKNGIFTEVITSNGKYKEAKIIGLDEEADVALLKIETNTYPVRFMDSDKIRVGTYVFMIGHPLGLTYSLSVGTISAKYRGNSAFELGDYIQIDMTTNPGNSGGPVFTRHGNIVGMMTMSIGSSSGPAGYGLAVPGNKIMITVNRLLRASKAN